MNDFTPQMVGFPDVENQKKIKSLYDQLVSCADAFLFETQTLFNDDEIQPEFIIKLLKMNKDELVLLLTREFIKRNNISYPGLNVEKLISQDLIDLPESYDVITKACEAINDINRDIESTKFHFPLSKLSNESGFDLTDEFHAELLDFTATFTASEKQNQVLAVVQKWCDITHEMMELGIVSRQKGAWHFVVNTIVDSIVEDVKQDKPLFPYRHMFKKNPAFNKFLTNEQVKRPVVTNTDSAPAL